MRENDTHFDPIYPILFENTTPKFENDFQFQIQNTGHRFDRSPEPNSNILYIIFSHPKLYISKGFHIEEKALITLAMFDLGGYEVHRS